MEMQTETTAGTTSAVADQLGQVLLETLKLDISPRDLTDDANLYELGLESLNVIALLSAIEKVFDIAIDVEDLSSDLFSRWANLVAFVEKKIHERA